MGGGSIAAVVAALEACAPAPMTRAELAAAIGADNHSVGNYLWRGRADGRVHTLKRGIESYNYRREADMRADTARQDAVYAAVLAAQKEARRAYTEAKCARLRAETAARPPKPTGRPPKAVKNAGKTGAHMADPRRVITPAQDNAFYGSIRSGGPTSSTARKSVAAAEPVQPAHVKVQRIPTPPPRYAPDPGYVGVFSGLGIGRYES
jgi:hypothetical protein